MRPFLYMWFFVFFFLEYIIFILIVLLLLIANLLLWFLYLLLFVWLLIESIVFFCDTNCCYYASHILDIKFIIRTNYHIYLINLTNRPFQSLYCLWRTSFFSISLLTNSNSFSPNSFNRARTAHNIFSFLYSGTTVCLAD